jgi:hypothetical protein
MDKLESLSSTLSNLTMYDIKSMYNQVLPITTLPESELLTWTMTGKECRPERQRDGGKG